VHLVGGRALDVAAGDLREHLEHVLGREAAQAHGGEAADAPQLGEGAGEGVAAVDFDVAVGAD